MRIPKPGPHLSPRPAKPMPRPRPTPAVEPSAPAFVGCDTCTAYVQRRGHALFQAIVGAAFDQGVEPSSKALAYFDGVHARHLSGKEI